jgi:hypothetical protein
MHQLGQSVPRYVTCTSTTLVSPCKVVHSASYRAARFVHRTIEVSRPVLTALLRAFILSQVVMTADESITFDFRPPNVQIFKNSLAVVSSVHVHVVYVLV